MMSSRRELRATRAVLSVMLLLVHLLNNRFTVYADEPDQSVTISGNEITDCEYEEDTSVDEDETKDGISENVLPEYPSEEETDSIPDVPVDDNEIVLAGSSDPASPTVISLNTMVNDVLTEKSRKKYYRFTLPKDGYISITFGHDYDNNELGWRFQVFKGNDYGNSDKRAINHYFTGRENADVTKVTTGLSAGTYSIRISADYLDNKNYHFRINYTESNEWEAEPDSESAVKPINTGRYISGTMYETTVSVDKDYYCFDIEEKGKVNVFFAHDVASDGSWRMEIFNEHGYDSSNRVNKFDYSAKERKEICNTITLNPGRYYICIKSYDGNSQIYDVIYKFKISPVSDSGSTGRVVVDDGITVSSLKKAFALMKDNNHDYVVTLQTDMIGEDNLKIPKTARSVTIRGNGHTIHIKGSSVKAKTKLVLENVKIKTTNKKDELSKLKIYADKGLVVKGVNIDSTGTIVNVKGSFDINSGFNADIINCQNMTLNASGSLSIGKDNKLSVKKVLTGAGGKIVLLDGFNKPINLSGTVEGSILFSGAKQADGKQILKANKGKISQEVLKSSFKIQEITSNKVVSGLYYYKGGNVAIFGESIQYNGKTYSLWKDALMQINSDRKNGARQFTVELNGNLNTMGAFKMPSKKYDSIRIIGNGNTITFTGNIKLTGDTAIENTVLRKVDKKGNAVRGKVVRGKYDYTGPEEF